MNSNNKASIFCALLCCTSGALLPLTAQAGDSDMTIRGVEGSVTCGGNHFNRNNGTETQRSNYVLRNVSDDGPIYLDRIRVYDAGGALIYDSDASGIPSFINNVLGNSDNTLDPRQSAQLNIDSFVPLQGRNNRPLQTVFDWSADEPTLSMEVTHIRTVSELDPATGTVGKQYARAHSACRTTSLKRLYFSR